MGLMSFTKDILVCSESSSRLCFLEIATSPRKTKLLTHRVELCTEGSIVVVVEASARSESAEREKLQVSLRVELYGRSRVSRRGAINLQRVQVKSPFAVVVCFDEMM